MAQSQTVGGQCMEEKPPASIAGIAAKYGLIMGVLSFVALLVETLTGIVKQSVVTAVISLALLVILMVLAHRELKLTRKGMMTYPQGLGCGTLLACVSAVVSSVLTYVYVSYINTGFLPSLIQAQHATLARRGITGAQAQQMMAIYSVIYRPMLFGILSLLGGVIIGFVVALIVSIFTQRGDPRVVR